MSVFRLDVAVLIDRKQLRDATWRLPGRGLDGAALSSGIFPQPASHNVERLADGYTRVLPFWIGLRQPRDLLRTHILGGRTQAGFVCHDVSFPGTVRSIRT